MEIKILHLYPDLLNLYGDRGNIEAMKHRLTWRGIDVEVINCTAEDTPDFSNADIVFLGGGSDVDERLVSEKLKEHKEALKEYIENGGVMLAVCGGFPMLGKNGETGLEILDIYSEPVKDRLISDVVVEADFIGMKITGFENHGVKTDIKGNTPLGKVLYGNGNSKESGIEGIIYKNVIGSNLHGPLLPKNPQLCDYILEKALKRKYASFTELAAIDDELEIKANEYIVNRYTK